jgi:hypothetical protein
VPIFIDRGAPLRNPLSAPNAADFPLQAAMLAPRTALQLAISINNDGALELNALSS